MSINFVPIYYVPLCQKEFYRAIVENMPQFIVVGPQSTGKSSALKRISGIKLPEAINRCTRVVRAIEVLYL